MVLYVAKKPRICNSLAIKRCLNGEYIQLFRAAIKNPATRDPIDSMTYFLLSYRID
jgi:hypothetical protein